MLPGLSDLHHTLYLGQQSCGLQLELSREHLPADVRVKPPQFDCGFSSVLQIQHRFQLCQDLEAVDELRAAGFNVVLLHGLRGTAEVADQSVVKCDHEADDRGLLGSRRDDTQGTQFVD